MSSNLATINKNKKYIYYFSLGENKYAVDAENTLAILNLSELDYPQKLQNNIVGLLKFNNLIINVLDIRYYLDLELNDYDVSNKILVIKTDEMIFGIIIDRVYDIVNVENMVFKNISGSSKYIENICSVNNEIISILAIDAFEVFLHEKNIIEPVDVLKRFPKDEKSINILKSRTLKNLEEDKLSMMQTCFDNEKYLLFSLNNVPHCIPIDKVKEVTNKADIMKLPYVPVFIEGLMNLRGDFITIVNLKEFLDFSETEYKKKTNVIVINSEGLNIGFLVDEINEVIDISDNLVNTTQLVSKNEYIQTEVIINDNIFKIMNVDKILESESLCINMD